MDAKEKFRRDGMPAMELHEEGIHGSGSSTEHFFKIEVRTSYYNPTVLGAGDKSFVIDNVWREWPVTRGATPWGQNVPIRAWDGAAAEHGMLSRVAAEAHRWSLLAWLEANQVTGSLCVETRLVKVEFKRTYTTKELGVSEPMKGAEVRRGTDFTPRTPIAASATA